MIEGNRHFANGGVNVSEGAGSEAMCQGGWGCGGERGSEVGVKFSEWGFEGLVDTGLGEFLINFHLN